MKIIGSQTAASVLTLSLDDVRPAQGIAPQQVIEVIAPRYQFATRPRPGTPAQFLAPFGLPGALGAAAAMGALASAPGGMPMFMQPPLVLQNGIATIDETKIPIPRIEIAQDVSRIGLQTITTDEGDLILNDLISVMEGACGFRNIKEFSKRHYGSSVIIQFEKGIEDYIGIIGEIQQIISPALKLASELDQEAKIERIGFGFDPSLVPASKAPIQGFLLERRNDRPFNENRYFSSAPLRTSDHIRVLQQIGMLLEGIE
jgi:hypothetical protein